MIRVGVAQHQIRNVGGIATYARGLVEGLGPSATGQLLVKPIAVAARRQSPLTRLLYEQCRIPMATRDVDVLHMSDLRIPLIRHTPTMATVHDIGFVTHPALFPRPVRRYKRAQFAAMVRAKPTLIACQSRYTMETVAEAAPSLAERCVLLTPGVSRRPARRELSHGPRFFLTVGSSEVRKNLDTLLRAYAHARARGLDLEWVAVGPVDRGDPDLLRSMREAGGVTVTGAIRQDELERLWNAATFLALPSVLEGFSYPVVEAMQRGVPVVASRGTALDETAGEAALRLDPHDDAGWVEAMLRLSEDATERQRLTQLGYRHAETFSWEHRSEPFVAAYQRLAG